MSEIDPQEFGELKATVAQLSKSVEELTAIAKKLTAEFERAHGGWKVLVAVASAGAAAATAFAWIIQHVQIRP